MSESFILEEHGAKFHIFAHTRLKHLERLDLVRQEQKGFALFHSYDPSLLRLTSMGGPRRAEEMGKCWTLQAGLTLCSARILNVG